MRNSYYNVDLLMTVLKSFLSHNETHLVWRINVPSPSLKASSFIS